MNSQSVQRNNKRITHNRWILDVWLLSAVRCFQQACHTLAAMPAQSNNYDKKTKWKMIINAVVAKAISTFGHIHSPTSYRRKFLRLFCADLLKKLFICITVFESEIKFSTLVNIDNMENAHWHKWNSIECITFRFANIACKWSWMEQFKHPNSTHWNMIRTELVGRWYK